MGYSHLARTHSCQHTNTVYAGHQANNAKADGDKTVEYGHKLFVNERCMFLDFRAYVYVRIYRESTVKIEPLF
jgi:hypothetical protein